ncbi:MAG: hypothetical protein PHU33_17530 [Bacteroidales bacterium]|nr:hypothetical protein [Bacteroidales bacterium]MDD3490232.1 hypothetical protein [Paludibacter sp.]
MKKYLLLFLMGGLMTSCLTGKLMTDEIISQNGTHTFENNYDQVWDAVKGALVTQGYELAYENKEKGIINTAQKMLGAVAQGNPYGAQSTGIYRQYLVKIYKESANRSKVVVTPKIYQGNVDISDRKVWDIEGKNGEVELWNKLFKAVEEIL